MFELEPTFHVLYGSNEVAFWTILASLLTFCSSLIIGVAGYKNAVAATALSAKASDREDARDVREAKAAAATSATYALVSLHLALQAEREAPGSKFAADSADLANKANIDARVELELLPPSENPAAFQRWFEATWKRMNFIGKHPETPQRVRNEYRGQALGDIRLWKHGISSVSDFPSPLRDLT